MSSCSTDITNTINNFFYNNNKDNNNKDKTVKHDIVTR